MAACPLGDLFDSLHSTCKPAEECRLDVITGESRPGAELATMPTPMKLPSTEMTNRALDAHDGQEEEKHLHISQPFVVRDILPAKSTAPATKLESIDRNFVCSGKLDRSFALNCDVRSTLSFP